MSVFIPDPTELPVIDDAKVAILASSWHPEYVQNLVAVCEEVLVQQKATVEHFVVPGTHEFPFAAQYISHNRQDLEAVICLSVVLKGDTQHFEMILSTCSAGLAQVMVGEAIIVMNGIVAAKSIDDVVKRTSPDNRNKGLEVGMATIRMIDWARNINSS